MLGSTVDTCTAFGFFTEFLREGGLGSSGCLGVQFLDEVVDMRVIVHVVFFVLHACWRVGYTVVYPQLQLIDKVLAPWFDELRGGFFRALYTGTGPGVVSTGTRPP